jgi:hypothetical protein
MGGGLPAWACHHPGVADRDPSADAHEALARHAEAAATVRAFAERARAQQVVLVIDRGDEREPALVECTAGGALELTDEGRRWTIPAQARIDAPARPLPDVRPPPPSALAFDPESGGLEAPLGAVANLANAVLELARSFGGRSVATADFATRDPSLPLTIAAREGEPFVIAAAGKRFVLPQESLG